MKFEGGDIITYIGRCGDGIVTRYNADDDYYCIYWIDDDYTEGIWGPLMGYFQSKGVLICVTDIFRGVG